MMPYFEKLVRANFCFGRMCQDNTNKPFKSTNKHLKEDN